MKPFDVQTHETFLPTPYMIARLREYASDVRAAWVWPKGLVAKSWPTPRGNGTPYLALVLDRRRNPDPAMTDVEVAEAATAAFWERFCGDWAPEVEVVALEAVTATRMNEKLSERVSATEPRS